MNYLLYGKISETIGAILLAYVGIRAAALEVLIVRRLEAGTPARSSNKNGRPPAAAGPLHGDLEDLRAGLETVVQRRRKQFGFYEAIAVGIGTFLIAVGCILYVAGLIAQPH